jgi:hypothetical protein
MASNPEEHLDRTTMEAYINERVGQGFTAVMVNAWRSSGNEGGRDPWAVPGVTPDTGYWQEVDRRIEYINRKGLVAVMLLGWNENIRALETQVRRERWARYVAARYSAYNACFVMSGEWTEWNHPDQYRAMGEAFSAADPHGRMLTVHSDGSFFRDDSWSDFSAFEQEDWKRSNLHEYMLGLRRSNKPCVLAEYAYIMKDAGSTHNLRNLQTAREKTWDIYMAGGYPVPGFGSTYRGGLRDVATFNGDEDGEADDEDRFAAYCGYIKDVFTSVDFTLLSPVTDILDGESTRYCLANPGQAYIVYTHGSSSAVTLRVPAASYRYRCKDLRNGEWTDWTPTGTVSSVSLTPGSSEDWAFVIEAADTNRLSDEPCDSF